MRDAIESVRQYREAVGDEVDLCIEIHRRLTPAEAVVLARGIEPFHPFFYEDPTLPDNFDAMGLIAEQVRIPIATGERLHTIHEFEMLLNVEARCSTSDRTSASAAASRAPRRLPHSPRRTMSAWCRTTRWGRSARRPVCNWRRRSRILRCRSTRW